jgi:hypothetical protein
MDSTKFLLISCCSLLILLGCSPSATEPPKAAATDVVSPVQFNIYDFPKAKSLGMTGDNNGTLYIIYGQDQSLFVASSTDGGKTFSKPVLATEGRSVHVLPVEHPALAANLNGQLGIAWLELPPDFDGAKIWYATSKDGGQTFESAQLVASESQGEVAMVQLAFDQAGNPIFTWLNGRELKFTRSFDQGATFSGIASIGTGTCECCQPQLLVSNKTIYIAYRSLQVGSEHGDIRDVALIRSENEGQNFGPVIPVADAHFYLPACPIAGPSLATHAGKLYVAWMDGRFEEPGKFSRGDAWLSISQDDGRTFSPNIRINPEQEMHHTLPTIAVGPSGRLHVAWEAQSQNPNQTFLYYTISDDDGQTFAPPQVIADNSDASRGNPGKPMLFVDSSEHVTLAWLDRLGARIASWSDTQ